MPNGLDPIPIQGVIQGGLADPLGVIQRGESDIRHHAAVLRAVPGYAVELAFGDLKLALGQRHHGLYRALAVGAIADNQPAAIVLNRAGKNLRGRGGQAVNHHHQRPLVVGAAQALAIAPDPPRGVANLYRGAVLDKQAGEFVGFLQRAAAVVAQVDDYSGDILAFELFQQAAHIAGGALVVLIAAAHGLEINVESGDIDYPEARHCALGPRHFDDAFLRGLLFQFDLAAHDLDDLRVGIGAGLGGQDAQTHDRSFRSADQLHDVVQAPADDIFEIAVTALGHGDDAIRGPQLALLVRRPGGHDAGHAGVLVFACQHRADTLQRQAHADIEILRAPR